MTYASDRLAPVVLYPQRLERGYGNYALYDLDLATGEIKLEVNTYGDDRSPAWCADDRHLSFISDRNGTPNAYLYDRVDSTITQLSDVVGGITSLSWSRQNDRLVYCAYNHGGFDVFAVTTPLSVGPALARLQRSNPGAVMTLAQALAPPTDSLVAPRNRGALDVAWSDTTSAPRDTSLHALGPPPGPLSVRTGDSLTVASHHEEPPAFDGEGAGVPVQRAWPSSHDTLKTPLPSTPLADTGGPFALSDSMLAQRPTRYHVKMAADYFGGGFYAATGYGFVGSTQLQFSDLLGDRNLFVAADLASSSIAETNILGIYSFLPNRMDYQFGLFHFKNYYSSRVTTFGEALGGPRLFSDRNFGALVGLSYPFDRFTRTELNLTQTFVDRQFFDQDVFGNLVQAQHEYLSITAPTVSLVGDNTLFGYYGPVNGARYVLSLSPAIPLFSSSLQYLTATADMRRYIDLTSGYTFASRLLGGWSDGHDAQTFRVGGPTTIRGYSDFDLLGTRFAIVGGELRFPFVQQFGLVGPVPLGILNLRGALFTDFGAVWNKDDGIRFWSWNNGHPTLQTPLLGFGAGIRTMAFFMIMKLDIAWHTDFDFMSRPRWHFSIGPEY